MKSLDSMIQVLWLIKPIWVHFSPWPSNAKTFLYDWVQAWKSEKNIQMVTKWTEWVDQKKVDWIKIGRQKWANTDEISMTRWHDCFFRFLAIWKRENMPWSIISCKSIGLKFFQNTKSTFNNLLKTFKILQKWPKFFAKSVRTGRDWTEKDGPKPQKGGHHKLIEKKAHKNNF